MRLHYVAPKPSYGGYVCYPDMFGRYSGLPHHAERREYGALEEYNLHLVFGGSGYADNAAGERIELRGGDGFIYPRQAFQQYGTSPGDPWDVRWIHFRTAMPLPMLREADEYGGWFFTFGDREALERLTGEMYRLAEPFETGSEPRLSALLYEILALLSAHAVRLEHAPALEKRSALRHAADVIRSRCGEDWSLERMAELAGYSPYHFIRMFRGAMGKTPNRFLTECRITLGRQLLVSSEMSVKEIAGSCGFAQTSYFIRLFRRSEGLSPAAYRRLHGRSDGRNHGRN